MTVTSKSTKEGEGEKEKEKEIEEGSVDDLGAEYAVLHAEEEAITHYQRLYKKRANMALALYHQIHQVSSYFSSLACSRSVLPLIYLAVLCQLFSHFWSLTIVLFHNRLSTTSFCACDSAMF